MQKTVYENYKYSLQDTAKVYIGAKYTFAELLEQDEVAFKFRLIVERYILAEKEVDPQDTLETHLYYLKPDSFLVKIYDRIKARVKINIIEEKKRIFGRQKALCHEGIEHPGISCHDTGGERGEGCRDSGNLHEQAGTGRVLTDEAHP